MEITPKQHRNLYVAFVAMFAISVGVTVWNVREQHKLRKLQKADLEKKNGSTEI